MRFQNSARYLRSLVPALVELPEEVDALPDFVVVCGARQQVRVLVPQALNQLIYLMNE